MSEHAEDFNASVYRDPDRVVDAVAGRTRLIDAVLSNDPARVAYLLKMKASPGLADKTGRTALHYAAELGMSDIMKALLAAGAATDAMDHRGRTPLFGAISGVDPEEVVSILLTAGADADLADASGRLPLHEALIRPDIAVMKTILAATKNIGRADNVGVTPLMEAARYAGVDDVKALLARGASALGASREGFTSLSYALDRDNDDMALLLLAHDAARLVNVVDFNGNTPLQRAVEKNKLKLVDVMLQVGANPNVTDAQGSSPLHHAVHTDNEPMARLLIRNGADVGRGIKGARTTPLIVAITAGHFNMVRLLLAHNADPNEVGADKRFPLLVAAHGKGKAMINFLINAGAEINQKGERGLTALHQATQYGHYEESMALIEAKANLNAQADDGQTPLHYCMARPVKSSLAIPQALLHAGADPLIPDKAGLCAYDRAAAQQDRKALVGVMKGILERRGIRYTPKKPPPLPPWAGFGI